MTGPMESDPLMVGRAYPMAMGGAAAPPLSHRQAMFNITLTPWITFVTTGLLYLYCYHFMPGMVVSTLTLWFALCFLGYVRVQRSPKTSYQARIGSERQSATLILCLVAVSLGACAGYWNYTRVGGVQDYWAISQRRQYTNVWPDELSEAHQDASVLVFAKGAKPDLRMIGTFTSGSTGTKYCVAPVVPSHPDSSGTFTVQYFVVGKDCCTDKEFVCGAAEIQAAHAGIVINNKTDAIHTMLFGHQDVDYYLQAADMSAAKFGVDRAVNPIFVSWVENTDEVQHMYWREARNFFFLSVFLSLPFCLVAALASQVIAGMEAAKGGSQSGKADSSV